MKGGSSTGREAGWAAGLLSARRALPCPAVSMLLLLALTTAAPGWELGQKRVLGCELQVEKGGKEVGGHLGLVTAWQTTSMENPYWFLLLNTGAGGCPTVHG